jgi:hypothetical protein
MEEPVKTSTQQNQGVKEVISDDFIDSQNGDNKNIHESKGQQLEASIVTETAYETIIKRLSQSSEEWWLVSTSDNANGYAYRQHIPTDK